MRLQRQNFGSYLTKPGKYFLIIYTSIYAIQLILEHWINIPLSLYLSLQPENLKIYQFVTHSFIQPDSPLIFLINMLVFYFFSAQIEKRTGTGGFFSLFYLAALTGALTGFLFSYLTPGSFFSASFSGMSPSLIALVFLFGLLNPNATILLFFIIPVRAIYLSYGTIIITVLTLLAKANPHAAYHLGGIIGGYIFLKYPFNIFRFDYFYNSYKKQKHEKKKRKFSVYDGGRDDDDKKGPTIH